MSYEFYKTLHLLGIILLFSSIGFSAGYYFWREKISNNKNPELQKSFFLFPLHGISLAIIFISGFGLTAKLQISSIIFYSIKIGIWLLLGMSLVFFKRFPSKISLFLIITIFLGGLAGIIGLLKP